MIIARKRYKGGFTLVEIVIAIAICMIPILVMGQLMAYDQKASGRLWSSIYNRMRDDSQTFTTMFGAVGRKANKTNYNLYTIDTGTYTLAEAVDNSGQTVIGDAVEFIYWHDDFDSGNAESLMDTTVDGNRYMLFYPENGKLKVDYGIYPPVGISGGTKRVADRTQVVIENLESIEFSHRTESKVGKGCVRAIVVISDPETGEDMEIKVATLLRNVWPR